MQTYKDLLNEIQLRKKKWTVVEFNKISPEIKKKLWEMYEATYAKIGLSVPNLDKLTNKYKVSWLIDIDSDDLPDAFVIYKETSAGNKIALIGSDGTPGGKKVLLEQTLSLLKKKGWYVEASHRLADIFVAKKVKVVTDKEVIKKTLMKSDIEMVGDEGRYTRKIGAIGTVEKRLFGNL